MDVFASNTEKIREILKESPPDKIQDILTNFCVHLSSFIVAYFDHNGEKGWSAYIVNSQGQPMLTVEQQYNVEKKVAETPWLIPFLKGETYVQKGGDGSSKEDVGLSIILGGLDSLRGQIQGLKDGEGLGFVKQIKELTLPLPIQVSAVTGPIPAAPFIYGLMALLDLFRYNRALLGHKNSFLTLLVFIEEVLTEQWLQSVLTFIGLFSPTGVSIGIIAKYMFNVFLIAQPEDIRNKFVEYTVSMGQSIITGFIAWILEISTPQRVRTTLQAYADPGEEFSFIDMHNKIRAKAAEIKANPVLACTAYLPVVDALKDNKLQIVFLAMLVLMGFPSPASLAATCGTSP
jgi:hypothetical protein